MADDDGNRGRLALIATTVKAALAIGGMSLVATHWLSAGGLDRAGLARLARSPSGAEDPVTTGSLARSADAARLDPCSRTGRP